MEKSFALKYKQDSRNKGVCRVAVIVPRSLAVFASGPSQPWLAYSRHTRSPLKPPGFGFPESAALWGLSSLRPAPRPRPLAAPLPRPASRRVGGAAGPRRRKDPRARTKECGEGAGRRAATARHV